MAPLGQLEGLSLIGCWEALVGIIGDSSNLISCKQNSNVVRRSGLITFNQVRLAFRRIVLLFAHREPGKLQ